MSNKPREFSEVADNYMFTRHGKRITLRFEDLTFVEGDMLIMSLSSFNTIFLGLGRPYYDALKGEQIFINYVGELAPPIVSAFDGSLSGELIIYKEGGINSDGQFEMRFKVLQDIDTLPTEMFERYCMNHETNKTVFLFREGGLKQVIDPENIPEEAKCVSFTH